MSVQYDVLRLKTFRSSPNTSLKRRDEDGSNLSSAGGEGGCIGGTQQGHLSLANERQTSARLSIYLPLLSRRQRRVTPDQTQSDPDPERHTHTPCAESRVPVLDELVLPAGGFYRHIASHGRSLFLKSGVHTCVHGEFFFFERGLFFRSGGGLSFRLADRPDRVGDVFAAVPCRVTPVSRGRPGKWRWW